MLRTTLPLALLLAAAIPATAQDGPRHGERERKSPEQRAEMHTSRMQEQLKLDDVQAEKVAEINLRFAEQMEAVRAARKAEQEGMKEKARGLSDSRDTELKAVLSEEQYTRMLELREQHMKEMKERRSMRKQEREH
ncbi:MAG TPA: hypothetical protein PLA11_10495 [Flavobacteriales bacterium]|nr:hypothetical protein [Flavobacteriales bacterium]